MASELSLPKDETVIAFHAMTAGKSAERGIAVVCGGLYWRNRFYTGSTGTWVSWEQFIDAQVQRDPNDADVWIGRSMQVGIGDGTRQNVVYEILLALQGELRKTEDQSRQ